MCSKADLSTRANPVRRAVPQPGINAYFGPVRAQNKADIGLEDHPAPKRVDTGREVGFPTNKPTRAKVEDINHAFELSRQAANRPQQRDQGLPTRFDDLRLGTRDRQFRTLLTRSSPSLKRKAEHEENQCAPPTSNPSTIGYRFFSHRRIDEYQQGINNPRVEPQRSSWPKLQPSVEADPIELESGSESELSKTSASTLDDAKTVVDLVDESEGDDCEGDVRITGTQKATKARKLVVAPRILNPKRQSLRVRRVGAPTLKQGIVVELTDGAFMKIHSIYEDSTEGYMLVGYMFIRAETFGLDMPQKRVDSRWKTTELSDVPDTRLPLYYVGGKLVNEVIQKIKIGRAHV